MEALRGGDGGGAPPTDRQRPLVRLHCDILGGCWFRTYTGRASRGRASSCGAAIKFIHTTQHVSCLLISVMSPATGAFRPRTTWKSRDSLSPVPLRPIRHGDLPSPDWPFPLPLHSHPALYGQSTLRTGPQIIPESEGVRTWIRASSPLEYCVTFSMTSHRR